MEGGTHYIGSFSKPIIVSLVITIIALGSTGCQKRKVSLVQDNQIFQEPMNPPTLAGKVDREIEFSFTSDLTSPYVVELNCTKVPAGLEKIHLFARGRESKTFVPVTRDQLQSGFSYDYHEPGAWRLAIDAYYKDGFKQSFERRVRSFNPAIDTKDAMVGYGYLGFEPPPGPPPPPGWTPPKPRAPLYGGPDVYVAYGFYRYIIESHGHNGWPDLIYLTNSLNFITHDGKWQGIDLSYPDSYYDLYYWYGNEYDIDEVPRPLRPILDLLHAEFSWDGTQIVFTGIFEVPVAASGEGSIIRYNDIYIVNADGTFLRKVTNDRRVKGRVQMAPEGLDVVYDYRYSRQAEENRRIAILDLTTGLSKDLTDGTFDDYGPAVSKDGKTILFTRRDPAAGETNIFAMSRNGTGLRVFSLEGREPSFSFDGSSVIFIRPGKDPNLPVFSVTDFRSGQEKLSIQTIPVGFIVPKEGEFPDYTYPSFTPFEEFYLVSATFRTRIYGSFGAAGYWSLTGTYNPYVSPDIPTAGFIELFEKSPNAKSLAPSFFSPQSWQN